MPRYLVTLTETFTVTADSPEEAQATAEELTYLGLPSDTYSADVEILGPSND